MKQTIFSFQENPKSEIESKRIVDFIYDLTKSNVVLLKGVGMFAIEDFYDEFTENPTVQIRHVFLKTPKQKEIIYV